MICLEGNLFKTIKTVLNIGYIKKTIYGVDITLRVELGVGGGIRRGRERDKDVPVPGLAWQIPALASTPPSAPLP